MRRAAVVQAALRGIANVAVTAADDGALLDDIRSTFAALDAEGNGRVPCAAFVQLLQSGGYELSDTEVEVLISQLDVDNAGCAPHATPHCAPHATPHCACFPSAWLCRGRHSGVYIGPSWPFGLHCIPVSHACSCCVRSLCMRSCCVLCLRVLPPLLAFLRALTTAPLDAWRVVWHRCAANHSLCRVRACAWPLPSLI
jgi:hypothetical protein